MRIVFFLAMILVLVSTNAAQATTLTLSGPALTGSISGWANWGLQITALDNVVLDSFIFRNQGNADNIWLTDDSGNILQTYAYGGGDPSHYVDISWSLLSGQTYRLIGENANNGKYAYYTYPTSNTHIRVDGLAHRYGLSPQYNYWFHFNDITTTNTSSVIPEPATMLLLGMGLFGLAGFRRKK